MHRFCCPAIPPPWKRPGRPAHGGKPSSAWASITSAFGRTRLPGTPVTLWLVDCPALFDRPGNPYQNDDGQDWWDNAHRYQLFCRVGAMMASGQVGLSWQPDIVHCNDWQSGLVPVFLDALPKRPGTVFTIHNLAYQGVFSWETFRRWACRTACGASIVWSSMASCHSSRAGWCTPTA